MLNLDTSLFETVQPHSHFSHHFPLTQNFISKCLESKEGTITKLSEDGEKLIAQGHPGKNVIEVQSDYSYNYMFHLPN